MKTKNVPKGLKCKINENFFSSNKGFPKGGGGGVGSATWEKFPNNTVMFFLSGSLISQESGGIAAVLGVRCSTYFKLVDFIGTTPL